MCSLTLKWRCRLFNVKTWIFHESHVLSKPSCTLISNKTLWFWNSHDTAQFLSQNHSLNFTLFKFFFSMKFYYWESPANWDLFTIIAWILAFWLVLYMWTESRDQNKQSGKFKNQNKQRNFENLECQTKVTKNVYHNNIVFYEPWQEKA